jgi:hypothetical protein
MDSRDPALVGSLGEIRQQFRQASMRINYIT